MAAKNNLKDALLYESGLSSKKNTTTTPTTSSNLISYNQPFLGDGVTGTSGTVLSNPVTTQTSYNQPFINSSSNGTVLSTPATTQTSYNQPFTTDGASSKTGTGGTALTNKTYPKDIIKAAEAANSVESVYETPSANYGGSYYSSSGSSGNSTNSYYDMLMAAIDAQVKAKRDAQLAALEAQLKQGLADYDAQINALDPIYQQYRNQSEVQKYKAKDSLRESLANRGALDSGLGRQEMLNLQSNYGNNLNNINMQYQAEVDSLNRAKQALNDEAAAQRIQIENNLENIGLENKIAALKDQISAQQNASRQSVASSLSQTGTNLLSNMNQQAQKNGRSYDLDEVRSALEYAYNMGLINENDVRFIKAYYGY